MLYNTGVSTGMRDRVDSLIRLLRWILVWFPSSIHTLYIIASLECKPLKRIVEQKQINRKLQGYVGEEGCV